MSEKLDRITREAVELAPLERLELVEHLLESLDMPDEEIEGLWAKEAAKRWDAYQAGKPPSVSASEVFEKYQVERRLG